MKITLTPEQVEAARISGVDLVTYAKALLLMRSNHEDSTTNEDIKVRISTEDDLDYYKAITENS